MLGKSQMKSPAARIVAIGFILIVLFGNLWLTYSILSLEIPLWMKNGFTLGFVAVLAGGAWMLATFVWCMVYGSPETLDEESDQHPEDNGEP